MTMLRQAALLLVGGGLLWQASPAVAKQAACSVAEISSPTYFGTKVLSVKAKEVTGYEDWQPMSDMLHFKHDMTPINFCNVTVTYTHPGTDDAVNVYVWLPTSGWNERYVGIGGGGWAGGFPGAGAQAVGRGYAVANTDAGHSMFSPEGMSVDPWALKSPGNVNWQLLHDFADTALDDMTAIAKQVVAGFYGKPARYSYWNGCSQGGRQGLVQAQRFPKNYDGILANAPAIYWTELINSMHWPQLKMAREKYLPPPCEFSAIFEAALEACDDLDNVHDGIMSAPGLCKWDATKAVGNRCCGGTRKVSKAAARIANAAYEGPQNGKGEGFALGRQAPFSTEIRQFMNFGGLAQTDCDENDENCEPYPFGASLEWFSHFLVKDPKYDPLTMTEDDFYRLLHQSIRDYSSILNADDPDLSEFREAGGKMITWHGLADQLLSSNSTSRYYERVLALDPKAQDYYRYFEAPGVNHCFGGMGFYPGDVWKALVDWVEKGVVPETLKGTTPSLGSEGVLTRPLCPYPKVAQFKGGDSKSEKSYKCADGFGTKKADVFDKMEL